jgi:FkbM family methyltransferase
MNFIIVSLIQKASFVISYLIKNSFSENKFLKTIIVDEAVVVDVGSNVGSFIKLILNVNKKVRIYSIEPNIELIDLQKKKFKNRKNIKFYNFAIDTKEGSRRLYLRTPASHSSFFKTHQEEKFNKIIDSAEVQTYTLEKFFDDQNINNITLLKIDIEGHDYEVFRSAKDLLLNSKIDYIKIEANQEYFEKIMTFALESNLKFLGISKSFYFKNKFNFMDIYFKNKN